LEGKFWLDAGLFEVTEAFTYNMKPGDKKAVRRIIFEHFDYLIEQWTQFQKKKS
jgi:hypothetical protein